MYYGQASAALRITELMPRNVSSLMNEKYDFSGWVEVYNDSDESFRLSDLLVSDGESEWQCNVDSLVAPQKYCLLFFDELNEGVHASFKLDVDGADLYLINSKTGNYMDAVSYPETFRNVSYGLCLDKTEDWGHLSEATPGGKNDGVKRMSRQSATPSFSIAPGFYETEQWVDIVAKNPPSEIYYTLDGSEPYVCDSLLYTTPVLVQKNTPIRAIAVEKNALPSVPLTGTFFVGVREIMLPVVSLVTDSDYFFGADLGIYVEGNGRYVNPSSTCGGAANYWGDESRPCNFEVFKEGRQVFSQEVKTKNSGACSRKWSRKSMKISASATMGNNRLDCQFFEDKQSLKWKSIVLRNDGNDLTFGNSILIRDGFIQSLINGRMDLDHLAFQPSVVFVNGSYYGVLNIRERSNEDFIYSNYGLDEESIDYDENIKAPSSPEYLGLRVLLDSLDKDNYSVIDSLIDINEWLNYFMTEVYVGNTDWPLNNTKFWKRKTNGKWRFILYDLDFGFWGSGSCSSSINTIPYAEKNKEFASIIKNERIFSQYISKFIVNAGTTFSAHHVDYVLDSLMNRYESELLYYWQTVFNRKITKWETNKEKVHTFAVERPTYVFSFLKNHYSLGDTASIKIVSEEKNTEFYLNGERIDTHDFQSYCFDGFEIDLSCCPPDNYLFDHWEITTADSFYISEEEVLSTVFHGPTTYRAVLTKDDRVSSLPKLYLNEICITNKMYVDEYRQSDDWIEIYNAGSSPIDLGGMYLSDKRGNLTKYMIPNDQPEKTTVAGRGYLVLWADEQPEQGANHLSFALSASKQQTVSLSTLVSDSLVVIDSVRYELHEKGETFARFSYDDFGTWMLTKWPTLGTSNRLLGYEKNVMQPDESNSPVATSARLEKSTKVLSVFPNPIKDIASVTFPWDVSNYKISCNGIVYMSGTIKCGQMIDLTHLSSGFYMLSLHDLETGQHEYVKLLKQ